MKIIQGSDNILNIQLVQKSTKEPFSLDGFTAATAFFLGVEASTVAVSGALVSADLGKLTFSLSDTFTDTMEVGEGLNVEVHVEQGNTKTIVQILEKLDVVAQLF